MNGWKAAGILTGIFSTGTYLIWKIIFFRIRERLRKEVRENV